MTVKLRIHGQRDNSPAFAARGGTVATNDSVTDLLDEQYVAVEASFNLSPAARAAGKEPEEVEYPDDYLLEFEVDGGFTTWISVKQYHQNTALLRSGEARADVAVDVNTLPQVSDRGVAEWVANRLRVLRVKDNIKDELDGLLKNPLSWPKSLDDLKQLIDSVGLGVSAQLPAWLATKALIRLIENRLKPGPGLYTWEDATRLPWTEGRIPVTPESIEAGKPILVFIHGTGSSTRGSFGAFLAVDAQPQWEALKQRFGGRIYAFEHRTMSDSPIDNAIDLLNALPPGANVNIVSHSRGGLVGDLISLTSIDGALQDRFNRANKRQERADLHDRKQLEKLAGLLDTKKLQIGRFVRCASPSRGTLLAGERVDLFLSVLTNLIQLVPGVGGTPIYEVTKRVALEIIRNRTEPSLVPGLEAMMPQSPLVAMLNDVKAQARGDVGVVAGDIAGGNWLKRISVFASDHIVYEARDNDLVVNTDSMFNGVRREVAGYVFDQGSDVSHFSYFRNARTRAALVDWLSGEPGKQPKGFLTLTAALAFTPEPMPRAARDTTDKPIVFVLPDVLGSELSIGAQTIWPDYDALAQGRIRDLATGATDVTSSELVAVGYRELCDHLRQSHVVVPFPYDWRASIAETATMLKSAVEDRLTQTRQPVRFLAHGMGGLVVRAMIATAGDLWDRLCQRDGRLVMLGTPNRGSFEVVETLLGISPPIQQLALLDADRDVERLIAIFMQFPGMLEMLPDDDRYFNSALWNDLRTKRKGRATPDAKRLTAALKTLKSIASHSSSVIPHAERVRVVAGLSPRTVTGLQIVDGRVLLTVTAEGDGRVTFESTRLPGVPIWYMEATHGDLASHPPSFPALTDLLSTGTTSRLATNPPGANRDPDSTGNRALPEPVLYPTEASLAAGMLGKQPRRPYRPQRRGGFRVKVVHGDLRWAQYPIVVGHYEGDTIVGAEAEVDLRLNKALSQRYSLGLYPGEYGSTAVILRRPTALQQALQAPSGAVVMGLGKWGELGAGQLADLVRRAALQYVLQLCDSRDPSAGEGTDPVVGLSVLLVGGASTTNITVGDSVGAILRAIAQANRELAGGSCKALAIQELEIIELYADRATEAAHAVNHLAPLIGNELDTSIDPAPLLDRGRDGRQRLRLSTERAAWKRWEVSVVTPAKRQIAPCLPNPLRDRLKRAVLESGDADAELLKALTELAFAPPAEPEAHREIRFLTLSERARAEANSQQRQPELVERLIKSAISQTRYFPEESRVLFELTVPNELKSSLAQVDNLVLVVDPETAAYPWELMSTGDKPLCVAKGLVRQLQTSNYRPHIGTRAGTAALVVGDPQVAPPFPQLPGAAEEANTVYDILLAEEFDVEKPLVKPTALEVLARLYQKPYRIIHLAGHGDYKAPTTADGKARSGLVLDNGLFLTAVEVGQMQQVPELVFLNACHIGQTGPEDSTGTSGAPGTVPTVEFNRLAASISRELIEMGVRAVVAAGWAVRDDAAKVFAETFYRNMLSGETFGSALKKAREHTYGRFPLTNTWGAYQAYGDPDYRLDPADGGDMASRNGRVAVAEFIEAVGDLAATADNSASSAATLRTLDELASNCPPSWREQTAVQIQLGIAYGRLGRYQDACGYLEAALAGEAEESTTTFFAVEQLANFEARIAKQKIDEAHRLEGRQAHRTQDVIDQVQALTDQAQQLHQSALKRLEGLLSVAKTAERYNLLGGTYRRSTFAERDPGLARDALTKAAESYRQAHELNGLRGILHPYPTLNWLTWAAVLHDHVPGADELLTRCEATAGELFVGDHKFYTAVGMADARLTRALLEDRLCQHNGASDAELHLLLEKYQQVIKQAAPTPAELDSTLGQLDSIADLLDRLAPQDRKAENTVTAERLRRLKRMIAGQDSGSRNNVTA